MTEESDLEAQLQAAIEEAKRAGIDSATLEKIIKETKERVQQEFLDKSLTQLEENCERLMKEHLVAIYDSGSDEQIGTGFLVNKNGRPLLVTAKHTLFGHNFDQDPLEKRIFVKGSLRKLGDLSSHDVKDNSLNDIAALYVDEYPLTKCLGVEKIASSDNSTTLITIHGYLGRDFEASIASSTLMPAPWTYTNPRDSYKDGFVAMKFDRKKFKSNVGSNQETAPIPSGLSGCPMLDAKSLYEDKISVIGIFTNQSDVKKIAFGESAEKLLELLSKL